MAKKLFGFFMMIILISCFTLPVQASEISDLKIDFPDVMTATAGKTYEIPIPFSGKGIDSISFSREGLTLKLIDSDWNPYPEQCTATVQLKANKTARFTMNLLNDEKGIIYQKDFVVITRDSSTSERKAQYTVVHPNGVNLRRLPNTSSAILDIIPEGSQFDVSISQNGWGYVSYNGESGFVSLQYCSEEGSASDSIYNPGKALAFAAQYADEDNGWLCAEFVSRALRSGGLEIDIHKGVGNLYRALEKIDGAAKYKLSVRENGRIYAQDNEGKLASGDVICMYCNHCASPEGDGKPYVHTVLVGDLSKNGIKVFAKNNSYNNELYQGFNHCICGSSDVIAYGFHFKYQ